MEILQLMFQLTVLGVHGAHGVHAPNHVVLGLRHAGGHLMVERMGASLAQELLQIISIVTLIPVQV